MASASRPFQVFVKPAGAACNLECRYCYYLGRGADARWSRPSMPGEHAPRRPVDTSPCMPDSLLEEYIVQHIAASPDPVIPFSWHGGEPTVLGLDYFRRIVAHQARHRPAGRRIVNGVQTNGILLDEAWCRFLAAEGFGVGLSLDGPPDLHDCYRVDRGQQPTHARVMRAYRLLRQHGVGCDILCVVHARNVRHPKSVYRFFKEIGARYVGFLPLVTREGEQGEGVSSETVPADAYGAFLCTIFDEWRTQDVGRIAVQVFEEAGRAARGLEPTLCVFRQTCGDVPVIERTGDFYSCDHFVDPTHRLGNIRDTPLVELLESAPQRAFGHAKLDCLPRCCRVCEVRAMCNGGCPKDRFTRSAEGEEGLNYLCAGLKRFFTHSLPHLRQLASPRSGSEPGEGGAPASAQDAPASPAAGRNDPCPCGSGRKYKKCCGR